MKKVDAKMDMNKILGKTIRALRIGKRVSQEDVAQYLGVSAQAVSKWETCAGLPDITLLPSIATYFGVSIDELFQPTEESRFEQIENMITRESRIAPETFRQSVSFLKDILANRPNDVRALTGLAELYNHRALADHKLASEYAKRALMLAPEEKPAWVAYLEAENGACGDEWYDNHFDVIEFFRGFLKENPGNFLGLYAIIENLLADRRFSEAEPYIEELRKIKDDHQAIFYLGDVAMGRGDREEALRLWNLGVEKSPDAWQAYCSRADRVKKLGMEQEAMRDYERCFAMQPRPRLTDGLYSLAQMHEGRGEYSAAAEDYRRILQCLAEDYGIEDDAQCAQLRAKIQELEAGVIMPK